MKRIGISLIFGFLMLLILSVSGFAQTANSGIENLLPEELHLIVNRIYVGDADVIRTMRFERYQEIINPLKQEADSRRQSQRDPSYNIFDLLEAQSINSFIGGLDNRDPRVRSECAGMIMIFLSVYDTSIEEIGQISDLQELNRIKDAIEDAIDFETVVDVKTLLERLVIFINRMIVVKELQIGDEDYLLDMRPAEFGSLITPMEDLGQDDILPIDTLHYNHADMLLNALDSDFIGIRANCAAALSRIYNEEITPPEVKTNILNAFQEKAAEAQLLQWGTMASYLEVINGIQGQ